MIEQSTMLITQPKVASETWCVYEHQMQLDPAAPPAVIYVNACKLVDLFRFSQGRNNSEWLAMVNIGNPVIVRIVATGQLRSEVMRKAMSHMRTFDPMPICNLRGINVKGARLRLLCSNGMEYANQTEAANDLGVSQSAISLHLRGSLTHVGGFTLTYSGTGAPDAIDLS
jgi:hypothetical protein